jgi:2-polyprenyl-3-methyl-5-hydroxy-6-metoxy-1,4-benzoquinol methylase
MTIELQETPGEKMFTETSDVARVPDPKEYCHDRLSESFSDALSAYDTQRRIEVLVDQFLTDEMLHRRSVLDVGCGLGFFSERLAQRGANVVACDLGRSLVEVTRNRVGCYAEVADALQLAEHFGKRRFDGLVSSECIEHTPDPNQAIRQMVKVVKPGGFVAISTPNLLWYPAVRLATLLRLRPFDGFENFNTWRSLCRALDVAGADVVQLRGLHLIPFQLPLHSLSRLCDDHLQFLRGCMINLCVLARVR